MLVTACIVTNTYNHLVTSVMSLVNQTLPPYRIIIGLNVNLDSVKSHQDYVVFEHILNYFPHISLIDVSNMTFSSARKHVALAAETEWILTFDGDQYAVFDYVAKMVEGIQVSSDIVASAGHLVNIDREVDNRYNAVYQMPPTHYAAVDNSRLLYVPFINSGVQLVKREVYLASINKLPDCFWDLSVTETIGGNDIFSSSLFNRYGKIGINYNAHCYHLRLAASRVIDGGKKQLELSDDWIPEALYAEIGDTHFHMWAKAVRVMYADKPQSLYDILPNYTWYKNHVEQE